MYQNVTLPFDAAHPLQVAKQGTFERWVEVNGKRRRYLVHIPHGCREAAAGIFILPPDGWTADDLLNKTHWRWLAEAEPERSRPILFFLEPQNGILAYRRSVRLRRRRCRLCRSDFPRAERPALVQCARVVPVSIRLRRGRGDRTDVSHVEPCGICGFVHH